MSLIQFYKSNGLTKREIETALLAIEGLSNSEIAESMRLSESTVRQNLSNVYGKLQINGRSKLIILSAKHKGQNEDQNRQE